MSINELFGTNIETTTNARTLAGTAALTQVASAGASCAIRRMEADIENYRDRIALSATDSAELDKLIDELKPLVDIESDDPLRFLDEDTVESMLKSQQSKRSRAKGKAMTLDNYKTLMTAAIAEDILRELYNKPKQAGGAKRRGSVEFTAEQLDALSADQVQLRKEIRNIQSKKSIMKSKADFDESSEAWQQLLTVESMLKGLRVGGRSSTVVEVDTTKDALADVLEGVDIEHLKAADAKELLARISELSQQ
jgi:hypothetical protein